MVIFLSPHPPKAQFSSLLPIGIFLANTIDHRVCVCSPRGGQLLTFPRLIILIAFGVLVVSLSISS